MTALERYAKKQEITTEIARDAGASLEQYIYDYSKSNGPALNAAALYEYCDILLAENTALKKTQQKGGS